MRAKQLQQKRDLIPVLLATSKPGLCNELRSKYDAAIARGAGRHSCCLRKSPQDLPTKDCAATSMPLRLFSFT